MNLLNKTLIGKMFVILIAMIVLCFYYSGTFTFAVMDFSISMLSDLKRVMAGQEVIVSIDITDTVIEEFPITAFMATIEYDKLIFEELTNDSFKLSSGEESLVEYNPENDKFVMDCNLTKDDTLVNITFKVKENFTIDFLYDTHINLKNIVASDGISEITIDDTELEIDIVRDIDEILKVELEQKDSKKLMPGEETVITLNIKNVENEEFLITSFVAGFNYDKNIFEDLTEENFIASDGRKVEVVFNPVSSKFVMPCRADKNNSVVNVIFKVREDALIDNMKDTRIILNSITAADDTNDYYIEDANIDLRLRDSQNTNFSEYTIIENHFISGIKAGTTVNDFKITINADDEIKFYNQNEELGDNDLLGTGMIVKIDELTEYAIVVTADLNGDGKVSAIDLSRLKLHIVNIQKLIGESLMAADINIDEGITAIDLSNLKKIIVCLEK